MIVLISGGCGFIGTNLTKYFMEKTYKNVIVVDNLISSSDIYIKQFQIDYPNRIFFIQGDITSIKLCENIKQHFEKIDEIYHLASIASPKKYKKHPIKTLNVGYNGTKNMLELCLHYANCKLLYSSTSEIYGDALENPQSETYYGNTNTVGKRSCYDESKRIGETLVVNYTEMYNMDTRIVRIFNTYGPYMDLNDGRIITEMIKSFVNKDNLIINGGFQTRSFSYIDDTIDMMMNVFENTSYKLPVNIGNDFEISIEKLLLIFNNVVKQITNNELDFTQIYFQDLEKDDPVKRCPNLNLYKSLFGKFINTNIDTGLCKTLEFYLNDEN